MTEQRKSYGELTRRDFLSMSAAFFGMAAMGGARAAGGPRSLLPRRPRQVFRT